MTGHVINTGNRLSGGVAGHVINMGNRLSGGVASHVINNAVERVWQVM